MKKLIPLLLITLLLSLSTSCAKHKDILTVYNATDYYIDCIAIAPEKDVLASEDMILFFECEYDFTGRLEPKSSMEIEFEIPADKLDDNWYVYVSGAIESFIEMYVKEIDAGAIFTDGTWGFQIDFDAEAENFLIKSLGDSDI